MEAQIHMKKVKVLLNVTLAFLVISSIGKTELSTDEIELVKLATYSGVLLLTNIGYFIRDFKEVTESLF